MKVGKGIDRITVINVVNVLQSYFLMTKAECERIVGQVVKRFRIYQKSLV